MTKALIRAVSSLGIEDLWAVCEKKIDDLVGDWMRVRYVAANPDEKTLKREGTDLFMQAEIIITYLDGQRHSFTGNVRANDEDNLLGFKDVSMISAVRSC